MQSRYFALEGIAVVVVSLIFALQPNSAGAQPSTEFDLVLLIENPIQTVGPNDNVVINAMLTNESTSPEPFDGSDASPFIFNGTLVDLSVGSGNPYNVDFGSLGSIFLNPGESTSFTFITLLPDPAPVAPGNYTSSGIGINYGDDGNGGQFGVNSTSGIDITVVPEPASVALLGLALATLALRRKH